MGVVMEESDEVRERGGEGEDGRGDGGAKGGGGRWWWGGEGEGQEKEERGGCLGRRSIKKVVNERGERREIVSFSNLSPTCGLSLIFFPFTLLWAHGWAQFFPSPADWNFVPTPLLWAHVWVCNVPILARWAYLPSLLWPPWWAHSHPAPAGWPTHSPPSPPLIGHGALYVGIGTNPRAHGMTGIPPIPGPTVPPSFCGLPAHPTCRWVPHDTLPLPPHE